MSDDITFCYNSKCKNLKCKRNPKNIRTPYKDHSYAYFNECEFLDVPMTYYTQQKEDDKRKV